MTDYYECPKCNAVSYNSNDVIERYCGRCNEWEDLMKVPQRIWKPSPAEIALVEASIQESINRG